MLAWAADKGEPAALVDGAIEIARGECLIAKRVIGESAAKLCQDKGRTK